MSKKYDPKKSKLILFRNSSFEIKGPALAKLWLVLKDEAERRQMKGSTEREKEAIDSIIFDCEMHYNQGVNMFYSMTDFFKFLDTEVQFHAKIDGLDIQKAKETYRYWAKVSHFVEYDKLFTEFFNQILDGRKTISKQELMVGLEGVDFEAVAENIAYIFQEATQKAESVGFRFIEMEESMNAAGQYVGTPCLEEAIILLNKYPSWLGLFELTKDPLITRLRNFKGPNNTRL